MRFTLPTLTALLAIAGCTTKEHPPWHHPSLDVADIDALTLLFAAYFLDGGTTQIYAITDTGKRCSIRLNQHLLLGEYDLDTIDSPGRLCFNNRLIAVRSPSETKLIELLRSASLKPIAVDDLRRLHDAETVLSIDIDAVSSPNNIDELRRHRDAIVAYVNTDGQIDAAENGIPYEPLTGG